jgi:pilus assembly protein Flp/PilA
MHRILVFEEEQIRTIGFTWISALRARLPLLRVRGPHELENDMSKILRFVRDESGATAIEYGLIAAGISVAIIAVVQGLGTKLNTTFTSVKDALK